MSWLVLKPIRQHDAPCHGACRGKARRPPGGVFQPGSSRVTPHTHYLAPPREHKHAPKTRPSDGSRFFYKPPPEFCHCVGIEHPGSSKALGAKSFFDHWTQFAFEPTSKRKRKRSLGPAR